MKPILRSLLLTLAIGGIAAVGASASRADTAAPPDSQLIDTSHQVSDIQKKIADLRARGQSARAGALAAAANCGYGDSSQVFLPWGDLADYSLAPQGDLSTTSEWTLKHADVTSDANALGSNALSLGAGDSEAISPAMCVNLLNPTIRLMMKDVGGNGKSDVKVTVLYEDLDGHVQHLTLARLRATSAWSPTITIPIAVNVLSTASASGMTAVAFDFKVEGLQKGERLELADLYVDPYCSR
ncbi:MAG TPA: hypothetical protein VFA82_09845 [Gaiellaceae bacterium]|nr:hypothetical protein [Gaiellaceae bacterium]